MRGNIEWIKRYVVDSLQIYFPASLEIQEELLSYGFQVPQSPNKKVMTPVPIIYCNFRGWLTNPEPITEERLIPPQWYNQTPQQLGWIATQRGNKRAFHLPPEEAHLDIGYDDTGTVYLSLDVKGYHLERTSIRGVNPEKWTNWAMFYLSSEYIDELIELLREIFNLSPSAPVPLRVKKESLQKGKEVTYYAYDTSFISKIGIPIVDFSICLGCYPYAIDYFLNKANYTNRILGTNITPNDVKKLKLRLSYDTSKSVGLKVGVAKIVRKQKQVMFKLASITQINIRGLLKPVIKGKARGKLVHCDHQDKKHYIAVKGDLLYSALLVTRPRLSKLPES